MDHCFTSCIDDFTSKSLSSRESACIARCVQKSQATSMRLSERFQENNAAMSEKMAEQQAHALAQQRYGSENTGFEYAQRQSGPS